MARIVLAVALAATLIAAVLPQFALYDDLTDDAYISFRYAERLASGDGLTFNPGERVEGFSNPLWTLVVAGGVVVSPFASPALARALGLASALLTLALMWLVVVRIGTTPLERTAMGATVSMFVLAVPGFHVYATAGLEVPLLMLLLTCGVTFALLRRPGVSAGPGALCFGLAGITRPEGPLYGALWFGADRLRSRRRWRATRADWTDLGLLVAPAAAYQVFRIAYFGAFLPNTFAAKPPGLFGGPLSGLAELRPWAAALGGPLLLIPAAVLAWRRFELSPRSRQVLRQAVGPVLAGVIFALYARGDWMPFGRFLVPIWPLVALCVTTVLYDLAGSIVGERRAGWRATAVLAFAAAMNANGIASWVPESRDYLEDRGILTTVMRGHDQLAQGTWIERHVAPESTIAARHIGAIAYVGSRLVVWDVNGLTDREQASFVSAGYPGGLEANPVLNRGPDVIAESALPMPWSYVNRPEYEAWLRRRYTRMHRLPHGQHGTVDVWIARDRYDDVFIR